MIDFFQKEYLYIYKIIIMHALKIKSKNFFFIQNKM